MRDFKSLLMADKIKKKMKLKRKAKQATEMITQTTKRAMDMRATQCRMSKTLRLKEKVKATSSRSKPKC